VNAIINSGKNKKMENQVNFSEQEEKENLSQSSSRTEGSQQSPEKSSLKGRILLTVLIYVLLLTLSFSVFLIYKFIDFLMFGQDPWEALVLSIPYSLIVFVMLVTGLKFSFAGEFLFFPFFPLLSSLMVIFVVVSILEKRGLITRNKKKFKRVLVSSSVVAASLVALIIIAIVFLGTTAVKQGLQFQQAYETKKPLESVARFIYPGEDEESGEILISGLYGNKKQKLFSSGKENIGYISPNGKYFVSCEDYGRYGDCEELLSVDNPSQKTELCFMETFDGIKVCPDLCKWDISGTSFVCGYRFNGFIDKQKEAEASKHDVLVVFDPKNGGRRVVVDKIDGVENSEYTILVDQNFALLDEDTLIFTILEKGSKFFKAENIHSCSPRIVKLDNLAPCKSFALIGKEIYCPVKAEEYGIEIDNEDDLVMRGKDHFIIKQSLDQVTKESYQLASKGPISEVDSLFNIDEKYLFMTYSSGPSKLLELETGLSRNMGGGETMEKLSVDEELILERYPTEVDSKKIPKVYLEDSPDSREMSIEQCGEDESIGLSEVNESVNQGGDISYNSRRRDLEFGVDDEFVFMDGQKRYLIKRINNYPQEPGKTFARYLIDDLSDDLSVVNGFEIVEFRVKLLEEKKSVDKLYEIFTENQSENSGFEKIVLGSNEFIKRNPPETIMYWTIIGNYQLTFFAKAPADKVDWESFEKMLGSLEFKL